MRRRHARHVGEVCQVPEVRTQGDAADAVRIRAARRRAGHTEGAAMKRYVKYRQACNCDAEPMPSMRTERAEGDGDYAGLAVLFYPQVCSRCKTPYREGPVMREVD